MTIKAKIILASALVFGLMLVVFAAVIYNTTRNALLERLDATLERFTARLQAEFSERDSASDVNTYVELEQLAPKNLSDVRFQIFLLNGSPVLVDTLFNAVPSVDFHDVTANGSFAQTVTIGGREYRCLWSPLEVNDRILYIAEVAAPTKDVQAALDRLRLLIFIAIPSVLVVTGLAAYVITLGAFRPMKIMADTARHITASNLHQQLALPKANDEVRVLGETFNGLLTRLEASFRSQKQFVADASHELRTPLTVLQSELEFAARHPDSPAVHESLQSALSEIERLRKLIEGLLLLARLDGAQMHLDPVPVRLDELCLESIQMMKREADAKKIRMDVYVEDPTEVMADEPKLKSALLNLIDNAIKYSNSGGVVRISLRHDPGRVTIAVEDHGIGIPASDLEKIFDRFFRENTSRPSADGNGLGLAIARSLVELHGGTLTSSSTQGKGSIFTISLPRS